MCEPASFVLTKTSIFWSMVTDSHTEIIAEHGLHEDGVRGVNVVKIEITPPGGDMRKPLSEWRYKLDQDRTPDWYDAAECEARGRKALAEWFAARVRVGCEFAELKGPGRYWVYNSTVEAWDNSTVEALGNSTVKAWDNSTVKAWDNSTVEALGNSTVEALGNSTVEAWDNSTVKALGNSTVEAWGNSTVKALGNSTVEALGNSTVQAWDNSTVKAIKHHATVRQYSRGKIAKPEGPMAVLIDCTGEVAVCSVGVEPATAK